MAFAGDLSGFAGFDQQHPEGTEWTRDDRLRQPVFLGVRKDKSPSEVV